MARIVDKAILLICGIAMVFGEEAKAAPVVAMLFGALAGVIGNGEWGIRARAAGALLFVGGCLFLPELTFFLPVVFYDCAGERQLRLVFSAAPALCLYYGDAVFGWQLMGIWAVFLAVAVLLALRTERAEHLAREMIRLRDTSTELNLVLREKNKDLLERQDYEIYLATLRERNRIAREIHDNVGHMLSRSILQMGALSTIYKEEPLRGQLGSVNETLNLAMNSIRESIHDLHGDSIDLRQAVAEATREMTESYRLTVEYDMSPDVARSVKCCFIATVKEAMSNIVKHSDADRIAIVLREHPGFYQLTVEDNGRTGQQSRGFQGRVEYGMGLENMRERVEALHGTLHIRTEKGFVIFISVPKEIQSYTQ